MYPPIAFQRDGDIWVANYDGSGESNLTQSTADETNPDWSPAGWSWAFSPEGGAPAGPWLAFDSDQGGRRELWVMRLRYNADNPDHPYEPEPATKRKITDGPGGGSLNPSWFAFTPKAEDNPIGPLTDSIAFAGPDEDGGESRIHYAEYDRQATLPFSEDDKILASTLTSGPGDDTAPAWSPMGDRIAYQSERAGRSDIYVMDPESSGEEPDLNVTQFVGANANPDWEAPAWLQDEAFPVRPRGRRAAKRQRRAHVGRAASVTPTAGGVSGLGLTGDRGGGGGGGGGKVSRECRKTGTAGADLLCGTPNRDVLRGKGGNDRILGRGGNDILLGGAGKDRILGGPGRDRIRGDAGDDRLDGGPGRDDIGGGPGRDRIEAKDRTRDTVAGGPGRDPLIVDRGLDRVIGAEDLRR